MSYTKAGILNKGKKIREYWDSINDAPVITPAADIAVESEAVFDEETKDKMDNVLKKSKKIAPVTKKAEKPLSEKQSRKTHMKSLRDSAYEKASAERKSRDEAEAERKAIERGRLLVVPQSRNALYTAPSGSTRAQKGLQM